MSVHEHRGRCAVVGVGETQYSRDSGRSVLSLATEAAVQAVADAGLAPRDVDGIIRAETDTIWHNDLAETLGLDNLTYWGINGPGGSAPAVMLGQAIGAILTGQATTVLCFRALNGRSGRRFGLGRQGTGPAAGGNGTLDEFFHPFGVFTPGQVFAFIARRHMAEYGTTERHLAEIAIAVREHANRNPRAQMHGRPLTLQDYLAGRVIADPLRVFDFCLETDGACAFVVTSVERARDLAKPPAVIASVAAASQPGIQGGVFLPALMRDTITTLPSENTGKLLFARAGLTPADVDVAQLYDCFTIALLIQLEDYGFCKKGEAGDFVLDGNLRLGGRLPSNTSGGLLSEAYIQGVNLVVEGVRQVRGESASQVDDVDVSLVTSGIPEATAAVLFTRDGVL